MRRRMAYRRRNSSTIGEKPIVELLMKPEEPNPLAPTILDISFFD